MRYAVSAAHTAAAVVNCETGNVVGMPVGSVRTESDDHVGLNAPDVRSDGANRNRGRNLINGAVRVAQDRDLTDTEHRGGFPQLRFTNSAYFNRIAATFRVSRTVPVPRGWR